MGHRFANPPKGSNFAGGMNLNILSAQEAELLRGLLAEEGPVVLCCHKSPDGDALGSSLAMAGYLRSQCGREATLIIPDAFPDFLRWLPETERIVRYDKHPEAAEKLFKEARLVVCCDFGEATRVDQMQDLLLRAEAPRVVFDHHCDPNLEARLMASRPEMSSTSEIIFRTIWQLGGFEGLSRHAATQIYCGMMTDTGGFTYNSTRPEIFAIIGQLLTKGINKDKIYRNVYNNYSSWAIRLRGYLMYSKLNVIDDLHAAYFSISRQEMRSFHFIKGDAEGLVNEPLKIKGLRLSISLREDDRRDRMIWVSLRSVDSFPCNKMAAEFFNGGGHLNASGGHLECSLEEAEEITRQAIKAYSELLRA